MYLYQYNWSKIFHLFLQFSALIVLGFLYLLMWAAFLAPVLHCPLPSFSSSFSVDHYRPLQRNRTNRCLFILRNRLTLVWRLRSFKISVVNKLETQESWFYASGFESKGKRADRVSSSLNPKGGDCPSLKTVRQWERMNSSFLSLFVLFRTSVNEAHIHWSGTIYFAQSTDLNVNLIQEHPHRDIQNNVLPNKGHLLAQPRWHIKWTIWECC